MQRSKRYRQGVAGLAKGAAYTLAEAIEVIQSFPRAKFDETVEMAFNLGVDPKKSDQMVRATVVLPNGTGKVPRTVVITRVEEKAKAALKAGAIAAGYEELIEKISKGWLDFDVIIASPEVMRDLARLGKTLGPKGLMPSPKAGTVTENIVQAVEEVKKGKIEFKMDRNANVQVPIGKISFEKDKLAGNAEAVIAALLKAKPSAAKGQYIKSATISSTMGPGLRIDLKELAASAR